MIVFDTNLYNLYKDLYMSAKKKVPPTKKKGVCKNCGKPIEKCKC